MNSDYIKWVRNAPEREKKARQQEQLQMLRAEYEADRRNKAKSVVDPPWSAIKTPTGAWRVCQLYNLRRIKRLSLARASTIPLEEGK